MNINPQHIVTHFEHAWLFLKDSATYAVCGEVWITPFYVLAKGHHSETSGSSEIVPGVCYLREAVDSVQDMSTYTCEIHDEYDEIRNEETPTD